jgi:hypothetical protein
MNHAEKINLKINRQHKLLCNLFYELQSRGCRVRAL